MKIYLLRFTLTLLVITSYIDVILSNDSTEKETLNVLIIDGQNNHRWMETTPMLVNILKKSGQFRVDVLTSPPRGDDISEFNAPFTEYDVVVSNYNGELWSVQMQKDFEEYVSGGGGFVVVHAASNAFPEWSEYNKMIGVGGWGNRNEEAGPYIRLRKGKFIPDHETTGRGGQHGSRHEFIVDNRAANHPIMKDIPNSWMHAEDELYGLMRGPAKNLTVLATAYSELATNGTGEHEPVLMTIDYESGRVFHTTLGHDVIAMECIGFQEVLLRGTEWAATGGVTMSVSLDFPGKDKVNIRKFVKPE